MTEVFIDTETTGLSFKDGHKIVEIACIETEDLIPTNKVFHKLINPKRDMPDEAFRVHGFSKEFLSDKETFDKVADDFLKFIHGKRIIIHNANFDLGFLNGELSAINKELVSKIDVIDSLEVARNKFPGLSNSLDALCKRYNISIAAREKHSAILDTELLSKVYIELLDKKEPTLDLNIDAKTFENDTEFDVSKFKNRELPIRLSKEEEELHKDFVETLGPKAIWKKINSN